MAESGSGTAARELDSVGSAGRLGTTLGGRRWRALSRRLPLIYGVGLLVLALLALLGTYEPPDADLWYHLAHGRYITETGDIPTTSYFSYQEPEREWVDYYWLFQVVVYSAWRVGGPGLVLALRAVVCLGFLVLLWRFLAADGRAARSPLWIGVLLGLATCAVWSRLTLFRPHTFSYLALLGFLVLFEGPERRRWWLIPLTVLWMNLHGIYYPVVLLIVAAYGAEWLMRRLRDRAEPAGLVTPLCSLGVLVAIFATPHGRALSGVPFVSTTQASRFVEELGRLPWEVWRVFDHCHRRVLGTEHVIGQPVGLHQGVGVVRVARRGEGRHRRDQSHDRGNGGGGQDGTAFQFHVSISWGLKSGPLKTCRKGRKKGGASTFW